MERVKVDGVNRPERYRYRYGDWDWYGGGNGYDGFGGIFVVYEPGCLSRSSVLGCHVVVQWRGRFRFGRLWRTP